ncbi:MAG: DUF3794 domain-containing protein [Oscillospiraceae bacterium]|nr:DUF3794 domain-containing protein [Oscillospiraceae bacterium]
MNLVIDEKQIAVCETVADEFNEHPVDGDFMLPDYCADVAAVLKCTMRPVIQSRQITSDKLIADGTVFIRILYLDENRRTVRSCEFSQPFSSVFNLRGGGIPMIQLTAKTDYINCRATSPRRLDIHGAFTVKMMIVTEGSMSTIADIAGDGVYTRRQPVAFTVPAAGAEKTFTINEVTELGESKPPAESIIRSAVVPQLTEFKLLINKAILKGVLQVRVCYVSDSSTGATDTVSQEIPFSQIIDVDGLVDDWDCDADLEVISHDIHLNHSQSGESGLLSVNAKIAASVRCYKTGSSDVVTDVYSVRYPLTAEFQRMDIPHLLGFRREIHTIRETIEMPADNIQDIVDYWAEVHAVTPRYAADGNYIDGRLTVCLLVRDTGGEISYYERVDNFTNKSSEICDQMTVSVCVSRMEYTVLPSKEMEINVQLSVSRSCYITTTGMAVSGVFADENAAFPPEKAALKIYYANKGESIWEIAKGCHTSMQAVMDENSLASEVLPEDTMLLVPMC